MAECPRILMQLFWVFILFFLVWPIAFAVAWFWIVLMVRKISGANPSLMVLEDENVSLSLFFLPTAV